MASSSARSVSHAACALRRDSFASSCACCQIVATAALLACCTDSGTATATGAACAVCALRHSFITELAAFISTRAARRTASTVGMGWRPDCSKRSAAAAMTRSRTSAGMAVDAWVMAGFLW
ncbi:hypothetical protein G6F59_014397 [Rhizopus arrhizus]|nr:hypothetical protein G6F59_014397 [Rhizopus arrhizus]